MRSLGERAGEGAEAVQPDGGVLLLRRDEAGEEQNHADPEGVLGVLPEVHQAVQPVGVPALRGAVPERADPQGVRRSLFDKEHLAEGQPLPNQPGVGRLPRQVQQ